MGVSQHGLLRPIHRERAWKLKTGKRLVGAAKRSNLDVESRAVVRAKEAALALRRRAAWIAKEVGPPFSPLFHSSALLFQGSS